MGAVFVTLSNVCSAIYPKLIGATVDTIASGTFTIPDILLYIFYVLLLTVGSGFFMYLTRKTIIVASRKIEYDLRRDFMSAMERQSMQYYSVTPTGSLMALASNDVSAVREFIGPAIMYSANTLTTFVFVISVMLLTNPKLTAVVLIPLPLIAVVTFVIGKKVHLAYKTVQEQFSLITTHVQEAFSGIRIIRTYVREEHETDLFINQSQRYVEANMNLAKVQLLSMPLMMILVGLGNVLLLGYGGMLVTKNELTAGSLTQFFMYVTQLTFPVAAIGWITNIIQRANASMSRIGKILDTYSGLSSGTDTVESLSKTEPYSLEFKNVSFSYPTSITPVLDSMVLRIPQNTSIGIVGSVGVGKSTITNLVSRLYDVSSGEIQIGGVDIRLLTTETLRNIVSVVPQEPFLFSDTIAENIRFGKPTATDSEVTQAAISAQLHQDILGFSKRYETLIGERGISLSGGQKQRLAIARALIADSPIIIFDDSLSAVDTTTERALISMLNSLTNKTILIIAHRLSSVQNCTNIIVLDEGRIIEQGTHEQLISHGGYYANTFAKQLIEQEIDES
jgi:ATP-binding cassette, subfamily B, multidrug efflux pump